MRQRLSRLAIALLSAVAVVVVFASATLVTAAPAQPTAVDARIEVVWPHDRAGKYAPVENAPLVNVRIYLFERGTLKPVPCDYPNRVRLWHDASGRVVQPMEDGEKSIVSEGGVTFPQWEVNDVEPPTGGLPWRMMAEAVGGNTRTNTWTHAAAPRGSNPAFALYSNDPQERLDVGQAVAAIINVSAPYPASNGGRWLVDAQAELIKPSSDWTWRGVWWNDPVWLYRAVGNGYLEKVAVGMLDFPIIATPKPSSTPPASEAGPRGTPPPRAAVWTFEGVEVTAAFEPGSHYTLMAWADGLYNNTVMWSLGDDIRTIVPAADVLAVSGDRCPVQ